MKGQRWKSSVYALVQQPPHLIQPSILIALTTQMISQSHAQLQHLSREPNQCS